MIDLLTIPVGIIGLACWCVVIKNQIIWLKEQTDE